MPQKEEAVQFFTTILKKINPRQLLPDILQWDEATGTLSVCDQTFQIGNRRQIYLIGMGKASVTMAKAVEDILGDRLAGGVVITSPGDFTGPERTRVLTGSHPLPDSASYASSLELLSFLREIPENSVVLNLLSGGASALFCVPAEGLEIEEIREIFRLLIQSGASIQEINTVRKVFSRVKGGQLLNHLKKNLLIDLIISDVPDDDRRFIGSGPTTAQEISYRKASQILEQYDLLHRIPESAQKYFSRRLDEETGGQLPGATADFDTHHSRIISSAFKLAGEFTGLIGGSGYRVIQANKAWAGPVDDFEKKILSETDRVMEESSQPTALVFYGECTVKVDGDGLGGRNQELALRMAKHLKDHERDIVFLSAGTDGIDGPTDAAGAVVDQNTYFAAKENGIDPEKYLSENDSYHFFEQAGGHIITGPTGNNLMDIQIILI